MTTPGALVRLVLLLGCVACRPAAPKAVETFPAGPDGLGVRFSILVVDVGESDATLVLGSGVPEERIAMLVDAGHGEAIRSVIEELDVRRLHYAVLSHYDPDHMRGFVDDPGLLWSKAMIVEEAKEKPAADRALELAEELAEELAKQKEEKEDKKEGEEEEPEAPEPQRPDEMEADKKTAPELPRSLVCTATALAPERGILDPGSPPTQDESSLAWWACASQLGRTIDHMEVVGGKHVGKQIDLGEGLTVRIVAGGGYVWGHDDPIVDAGDVDRHSIVLLISNGQGFEFLLMPSLGGKERRALANTRIEDAIAETLVNEGIDIDILRVGDHGAENVTSRKLVSRTKPEVAIISTGDDQAEEVRNPRCRTLHALSSGGVGVVLQTEAGNPDCNPRDEQRRFVANGTLRIDVTGSDYTISTVGTRSLVNGKKTRHIAFACSLRRGCWFKQWE